MAGSIVLCRLPKDLRKKAKTRFQLCYGDGFGGVRIRSNLSSERVREDAANSETLTSALVQQWHHTQELRRSWVTDMRAWSGKVARLPGDCYCSFGVFECP